MSVHSTRVGNANKLQELGTVLLLVGKSRHLLIYHVACWRYYLSATHLVQEGTRHKFMNILGNMSPRKQLKISKSELFPTGKS